MIEVVLAAPQRAAKAQAPRSRILKTEDGEGKEGTEESQRSCYELILLFALFT
ncbi:hypothetical protein ACSFBX_17485 [Variovorax sp. RB2P76]|uniref:hypothetical protein n=1 Tax=Variovorax sp. RB2P76 TaxID=3443736 RepID=UPI003F480CD2